MSSLPNEMSKTQEYSTFGGTSAKTFRFTSPLSSIEGINADLRHYIPTLARRSRCFARKLENLQAVIAVFVEAYNRFGAAKHRHRQLRPTGKPSFSLVDFI